MFLHVPGVLTPEELAITDAELAAAQFTNGKLTASLAAREVKNNQQLHHSAGNIPQRLEQTVTAALTRNQLIAAAALPTRLVPLTFSNYQPGMAYGWHTDGPTMGNPPVRTDIAVTLFLSDPESYQGGELEIEGPAGLLRYKLPKGDAILYPTMYIHRVAEVTAGHRYAAVTWIQSAVRNPAQRELLFSLNNAYSLLMSKDMHSREAALLLQSYSNLMRMWAEV